MSTTGYKWLRAARIAVSLTVLATVTATVACGYSCWLSRWQIIPALLAGAGAWLLLWAAVTALAGRIYCSTACPLGTLQDITARLRRRPHGYFFSSPRPVTQWSIVFAVVVAALLGISAVVGILDPAAAYSRIVAYLGRPLAGAATFSLGAATVALATLAAVTAVPLAHGRLLCNTICPVGTLLGGMARFSLYHIDINTDRCTGCGLCTARCKAGCIDPSAHTVDPSRCVMCFDCTAVCPDSAITLRRGRHRLQIPMLQSVERETATFGKSGETGSHIKSVDRRRFFIALAAVPLAAVSKSRTPNPGSPADLIYPPGAAGDDSFHNRCTGCGLCTAACPTGIIQPAISGPGFRNALHPVLDLSIAPCRYDCVACTQVCPTGALSPLTPGRKHRTPIGKAHVRPDLCIEYAGGDICGRCVRTCPARAISILPAETDGHARRRLPHIDTGTCIGCGACLHVCPAEPRAIIIEGIR